VAWEQKKVNVVRGQKVVRDKVYLARRFRRSMTEAEEKFWKGVRGRKIGGMKFRRQQVIAGFVVDFFCARSGLVVEIDGSVHDDRLEYDLDREAVLKGMGLKVLRFSNEQIMEGWEEVKASLLAAGRLDFDR